MNSTTNSQSSEPERIVAPVWRQAFRPFFLGGALFSALSIGLWALVLAGKIQLIPYGNPVFWHAHEMMFGFVCAIIVGFLLTAVQNWTGIRATNGKPLIILFLIWLLARVGMLTGLTGYEWVIALVDISFLPLAAFFMARILFQAGNRRNFIFLPILILLGFANVLTHLSVITENYAYYTWGINSALTTVVLIMTLITGRVVPMFTANGLGIRKVENHPWVEYPVIVSTLLIAIIYASNLALWITQSALALLFMVAFLSSSVRALRWQPWKTLSSPLLWSLQLAFWFIPVGHALFVLHLLGYSVTSSAALHSFTAGAMGSLILAMIARVSLGHTGRKLAVRLGMKIGLALILLAGALRVLGGVFQADLGVHSYLLAALFWVAAFILFVIHYRSILMSPRPDGKIG